MVSKTFTQYFPRAAMRAPVSENTIARAFSSTGHILMQASQVVIVCSSFISFTISCSYRIRMRDDVGAQDNAEWYMCIADCLIPSKDRRTNLSQSSIKSNRAWAELLIGSEQGLSSNNDRKYSHWLATILNHEESRLQHQRYPLGWEFPAMRVDVVLKNRGPTWW